MKSHRLFLNHCVHLFKRELYFCWLFFNVISCRESVFKSLCFNLSRKCYFVASLLNTALYFTTSVLLAGNQASEEPVVYPEMFLDSTFRFSLFPRGMHGTLYVVMYCTCNVHAVKGQTHFEDDCWWFGKHYTVLYFYCALVQQHLDVHTHTLVRIYCIFINTFSPVKFVLFWLFRQNQGCSTSMNKLWCRLLCSLVLESHRE